MRDSIYIFLPLTDMYVPRVDLGAGVGLGLDVEVDVDIVRYVL